MNVVGRSYGRLVEDTPCNVPWRPMKVDGRVEFFWGRLVVRDGLCFFGGSLRVFFLFGDDG